VGKRYTKEEISRIQALTEEGLTSNEIAIQLDRPEAGIRNIRYRMKMKLNQKESLKQLKRDRKLLSEKVNRLKRDIHNLNSRKKNIEKVLLTDEATLNTRLQTALRKLKDVRPDLFFPAWREIDNLIFELGSMLDFFFQRNQSCI
jgi:chromosome segregation ATPase